MVSIAASLAIALLAVNGTGKCKLESYTISKLFDYISAQRHLIDRAVREVAEKYRGVTLHAPIWVILSARSNLFSH